jgi:eukaryotic-like serine/threonine-protein kinase
MPFAFNGFVLDPENYRLWHADEEVPLERRTFDLLRYLVEHRERVVPKQELLEQVWGARVLSEGVLSNAIAKLRRALGQDAGAKRPIETVHGRGYRFHGLEISESTREPAPRAPSPQPAPVEDPFVGRESLMAALVQRLERARDGQGDTVVLSGEAGIGKTRMLRELALRARALDVRVWIGAAYEGSGAPAYWPWIQILRAAREALGDAAFTRHLPAGAWAIGQLVPELGRQAPDARETEPQTARFQLFDELTRFLRDASTEGVLLVCVDDLHWADLGSVDLLGFAARALQDAKVMLVATSRPTEVPTNAPARSPIDQLARVAAVLPLSRLSTDEVSELAKGMRRAASLDETRARALHTRTQGNPFFVRQALDLMTQRDDWSFVDDSAPGGVPPAISDVIRRRIAVLTERTRGALAGGAVMGQAFDVPVLSEALGVTPEALFDDLEPALRVGMLERRGSGDAELAFSHVLARDTLYDDMAVRERGALHKRLADALVRRHGEQDSRHLGAIAHHALHALPFELERAIDACRRAAAAAQEALGFEAATQLRMRALHKLEIEGGDCALRVRLLVEIGEDHFYGGRLDSSWATFREAAETAKRSGRADLLAEVAPRLADCVELGTGDLNLARACAESALADLPLDQSELRAALLAQRAELAIELPPAQRMAMLDEAESWAAQSGKPFAALEVAHTRATLRIPTELRANALAAEHFLALLDRHPEAAATMRYRSLRRLGAHVTRYLYALNACDLAAADAAVSECARVADTTHIKTAHFVVGMMRAGRALGDGRLDVLEGILRDLQQHVDPAEPSQAQGWGAYFAALAIARGDIDKLARVELPDVSTMPGPSRYWVHMVTGLARIYAVTARPELARRALAHIPPAELSRAPAQHGDLGLWWTLAETLCALGDRAAAQPLYDRMRPFAAYIAVQPSFEYSGALAHQLGMLARLLGNEAHACDHFREAIEINSKLGMTLQITRSQRELHG